MSDVSERAESILREDEEIVWSGSMNMFSAMLGPLVKAFLVLAIIGMAFSIFIVFAVLVLLFLGKVGALLGFLLMVGVVFFVPSAVVGLIRERNSEYIITNKRIISFSGYLRTGMDSLEWGEVVDVSVEMEGGDKVLSSGTVVFTSRMGQDVSFPSCVNPYEAVEACNDVLNRDSRN